MKTIKKIRKLLLFVLLLSALLIPQTAVLANAQDADDGAGSEMIKEAQETEAEAGYEMTAETRKEQTSGLDFSSMRIMVGTQDEGIFADMTPVLSSYHGVYLLQFEDEESAKDAYVYYLDKADFVEVDKEIMIADETAKEGEMPDEEAGEGGSEAEEPDTIAENQQTDEPTMTEDDNPFREVENAPALNDSFDIALIDSGASDVNAAVSLVGDIVEDENGHGTKMAGLIKEQNPEAAVLSVRVLDADGHGDVSAVYAAMEYAMEQNVKIINLSMSAVASADSEIIRQAVQRAVSKGITVVGAAGNNGNDVRFFVPGSIEPALIVGAANEDGSKKSFSNYGETVDYFVAADATSEAAAKMSGFLSANGEEGILPVLNRGLIFDPAFSLKNSDVALPEEDSGSPSQDAESGSDSGSPSQDAESGSDSESLSVNNGSGMQAASHGFGPGSLTSRSFDQIKPYLNSYLGIPYVSPCAGLVNWGAKTASGFDCSGFVNAMVHWFYDDGTMDYPYTGEAFASSWWKPALGGAGLWVCGGASAQEIRNQVSSGQIRPGDIVVFGDFVHVAIVYEVSGNDAKLIHAYSSKVQTNWLASEVWAWDGASFEAAASDFQAAGQGTAAEGFQAAGSGTYFRYDVYRGCGNDGYLKLHKDSRDTQITNGNNCYSLAGAVYTVYQGSSVKGTMTTDAYGNTAALKLPVGSYVVKETTAAKGYELDPESYPVTISAANTSDNPYQLNVKDGAGYDGTEIEIIKKAGSDYATRFPLSGTQFTIRYYDNTDGDDSGEAVRTWCVEIKAHDEDGKIVEEEEPGKEYRYLAKLNEEYLDEGSDELFKVEGKTVIPLGTISVEETKTAPGYTLTGSSVTDGEGREAELIDGKFITTVTMQGGKGKLNFGNLYTVLNTPIEVHTLAVNQADGTHLAKAGEPVTIVDTVTMKGTDQERLVNDKGEWDYIKYRLKGYIGLLDADGMPVTDENGEPIRLSDASTHFITEHFDGHTEMLEYTIEDTSMLEGKTIYVAEYLYRYVTINQGRGVKYDEETLVACEDETVFPDLPEDMKETQRIHFPKIGTSFTEKESGSHKAHAAKQITLVDEVRFESLIPGVEYQLSGTVMDKETGKALTDPKGHPYTVTKTFVPDHASGSVQVPFVIDGEAVLNGKTLVAFEELSFQGKVIADHKDPGDAEQTVTVISPEIRTTLSANDTSKRFDPVEELKLNDEVMISNMDTDTVYVVRGYLVDQTSGRYLMEDGNGSKDKGDALYSEVEFLATEPDAKLDVAFQLKADNINFDIVCFEELYEKSEDENGNVSLTLVAEHADINNDAQTVRCTASAPKTGDSGKVLPWLLLMIAGLSGTAVTSAVVLRKKI